MVILPLYWMASAPVTMASWCLHLDNVLSVTKPLENLMGKNVFATRIKGMVFFETIFYDTWFVIRISSWYYQRFKSFFWSSKLKNYWRPSKVSFTLMVYASHVPVLPHSSTTKEYAHARWTILFTWTKSASHAIAPMVSYLLMVNVNVSIQKQCCYPTILIFVSHVPPTLVFRYRFSHSNQWQ